MLLLRLVDGIALKFIGYLQKFKIIPLDVAMLINDRREPSSITVAYNR